MSVEWTDGMILRLAELWREGLPIREIGERIAREFHAPSAISKNAVVGKVHRLGLEQRPSPISGFKPRSSSRPPSNRTRAEATQLPKLPSLEATPPIPVVVDVAVVAPVAVPPKAPPLPPHRLAAPTRHECQWPIGDVKAASFRFCCDPVVPGKVYCLTHCKSAFVKRQFLTFEERQAAFAAQQKRLVSGFMSRS